ncbi:energy transducer TonB [Microbulbifer sp. SSSA008]|uniref:energy transducer TonB n=1 Tax=unclassified Microbulbifer TaxID=2619833 RepID=UPI00403921D2
MKQALLLLTVFFSQLVGAEEDVYLITRESDFCAGKALNPDHCQDNGMCYHFKKTPIYPLDALKKGVEGFAKVKFDTDPKGCTINHKVYASSPAGVFDQAAIDAIKNYQYSGGAKGIVETVTFSIQK